MKKLIFFATLCLCLNANSQNLAEQLIRIHNVLDTVAMNALPNPEDQIFVYVVDQDLTYQYVSGDWYPFLDLYSQEIIDSLVEVATYLELLADSCCGINTSSPDMPFIGKVFGCGVIFYLAPDFSYALICALEGFNCSWGCSGTDVSGNGSLSDGQANTNAILNANCSNSTHAANICVEMS